VKVRVSDVNDPAVFDDSDNSFKIDYYQISWQVFDLLTNAPLSDLAVTMVDSTDPVFIQWQEVGITTTTPRVQPTPYGSWLATWTKTGYGDGEQLVVADQDQSFNLKMETSAVHIWRAVTDFTYTPAILAVADDPITPEDETVLPVDDKLDLISFLERDGSVITGVVYLDLRFYEGSTEIKQMEVGTDPRIYDGGVPPAVIGCYNDPDNPLPGISNAQGIIAQQWSATTLEAGKAYALVTTALISTCGKFVSPKSLTVTETQKLDDLQNFVATQLDTPLSQVKDDIAATVTTLIAAQTLSLEEKLDDQTDLIQTTLTDFTDSVQDSIVSLEDAVANSLASAAVLGAAAEISKEAALDLQEIGRRQAASLLIPASVVTGESVQLRYRGYTEGLIPLIDILDDQNKAIFQATPMKPLPDKPAIYEFIIDTVDAKIYKPGTLFTVIVTESSTGSIESGAVFVEKAVGQLLIPGTVLLGDKLDIRYRGRPDWKPLIKVIDFENEVIIDDEQMQKVKDETDLFEYKIAELSREKYTPGKPITITVTEKTTDASATGTILIESTSLSSLEGLVAAGSGQKSIIQDTLDAINVVKGNLATGGDIGMALEEIRRRMRDLPKELADEQITTPIIAAVDEMREQFMSFAGDEGYDFKTLLETGLEESATIIDIRKSTDEVQGAAEVMQRIMEQKLGGEDAPIVHSFFH
jgi:hypothetical protein